ncbi:HAMP domain-containing sensor histidine kinase [Neobacillus sp. WH10]|uniref:sensor histidine kinase n=1 Tax=Neobacillus sp. WH10 TaxID=3047873 RepID=UPI0024C103BE|nr:HAMP domain-containing sensor histidine kinase [Neobacillus sp. WH10]WHY79449.1 HAMP domain-containing sensor histidine kinase [Neobacillus sp. WH10]
MKNLNFPLRWRISIFTALIVLASSAILVVFINLNVSRLVPNAATQIIGYTQGNVTITPNVNPADQNPAVGNQQQPGTAIIGNKASGSSVLISNEMQSLVNKILVGSIIILIITVIIGGVSSHLVAVSSLKPLKKLIGKIRALGADNLADTLPVPNQKDEIRELSISFNQMFAKLNNAFDSQKRFNAGVAHELKTPLTVIKSNISAVLEQEDCTAENYKELCQTINQSATKMNLMIEELLEMVSQENASLDDNVSMETIIYDVCEDISEMSSKKNIKVDCVTNHISLIKGNEILLYRAVFNIAENAVKYTQTGGKIHISCVDEKNQIKIVILDNGIGIEDDKLKKIFEPFYRTDRDNSNGHGLGLPLAKSVILRHGGEILVDSTLGSGTTFTIKIPK